MSAPYVTHVNRLLWFVAVVLLCFAVMSAERWSERATIAGLAIMLPCTAWAAFGIRELAYLVLGDSVRPWYAQRSALKILVPLILLVGISSVPVSMFVYAAGGPHAPPAEVAWAAMAWTLILLVLLEQRAPGAGFSRSHRVGPEFGASDPSQSWLGVARGCLRTLVGGRKPARNRWRSSDQPRDATVLREK